MKAGSRQFADFYITRLEFFSKIGLFPMQWSEQQQKFVVGPLRDTLLNAILSLSVLVDVLYLTLRTGIYLFLTPKEEQEFNEKVLLITWTITANASLIGIATLWKGATLVRIAASSVVKNVAKLRGSVCLFVNVLLA